MVHYIVLQNLPWCITRGSHVSISLTSGKLKKTKKLGKQPCGSDWNKNQGQSAQPTYAHMYTSKNTVLVALSVLVGILFTTSSTRFGVIFKKEKKKKFMEW